MRIKDDSGRELGGDSENNFDNGGSSDDNHFHMRNLVDSF